MIIKRFTPAQKLFHLLLMASFLMQAATGMGRMFIETTFGRSLAGLFGGYESCLAIHKAVGLFMIALFLAHLVYVLVAVLPKTGFGPDSLFPGKRDARDLFKHVAWMFGAKTPPAFERWGYWEKFDYWAVFWGMVVIGGTGLMLYNPLASSRVFEGWTLNVAFWIHRIEAILAILHVFIIHFLIAHMRRPHFPMDPAIFAGGAHEEDLGAERADWIRRLKHSGKFEALQADDPPMAAKIASYVVGLAAVACGLYLLIGGLLNAAHVTW